MKFSEVAIGQTVEHKRMKYWGTGTILDTIKTDIPKALVKFPGRKPIVVATARLQAVQVGSEGRLGPSG